MRAKAQGLRPARASATKARATAQAMTPSSCHPRRSIAARCAAMRSIPRLLRGRLHAGKVAGCVGRAPRTPFWAGALRYGCLSSEQFFVDAVERQREVKVTSGQGLESVMQPGDPCCRREPRRSGRDRMVPRFVDANGASGSALSLPLLSASVRPGYSRPQDFAPTFKSRGIAISAGTDSTTQAQKHAQIISMSTKAVCRQLASPRCT